MTWPNDDLQSKIAFFGDPNTATFQKLNLVTITPPFQIYYDSHPIKTISVNRKIATALLLVFTDILDKCGHDQRKVDATGISAYGGCYSYRPIRGSSAGNLSNHAFGAAIDIDPANNPLGAKIGKMPALVVNAFKAQGFLWGGDYKTRKDPMHFEAVSRK
jgi:D-alanyl-D-alanine carboxypeptidase